MPQATFDGQNLSVDTNSRPLRILHIGNIANNAYKNAKLLNESGFDCDVVCHDFYLVMGTPEWEDAEIDGHLADQFFPDWSSVNLHGFKRPRWFAQGPVLMCIAYLLAKRRNQRFRAYILWKQLEITRWLFGKKTLFGLYMSVREPKGRLKKITRFLRKYAAIGFHLLKTRFKRGYVLTSPWENPTLSEFDARASDLIQTFHQLFPNRPDQLTSSDMETWLNVYPHWKALFA